MPHPLQKVFGKGLDGFKIENCTEVHKVDENGERIKTSCAYFRDAAVARTYRGLFAGSTYKIREVLVLSNASIRILVGDSVMMPFADEDVEFLNNIRQRVLEKLSKDERALLGL